RQPLVGGLAADAKVARRGGDRAVELTDTVNQCKANLVHGGHLPGHCRQAPSGPSGASRSLPATHPKVLPMSLHYLSPMCLHQTPGVPGRGSVVAGAADVGVAGTRRGTGNVATH